MRIRVGFITNSSSTNFLIISKEELDEEVLFRKLGFVEEGSFAKKGHILCEEILAGIRNGVRYYDYESPNYDNIKEIFGINAARHFKDMKGAYTYWGCTRSEDDPITQFFTTDSFEVEEKDFYINGRSCVW